MLSLGLKDALFSMRSTTAEIKSPEQPADSNSMLGTALTDIAPDVLLDIISYLSVKEILILGRVRRLQAFFLLTIEAIDDDFYCRHPERFGSSQMHMLYGAQRSITSLSRAASHSKI